MKIREYEYIMQRVLHLVDEGVHVIDKNGNTIIYNDAMARLEKTQRKGVLKKPFTEVFHNMSEDDSTLLQALYHKKVTLNQQQTYLNQDGKTINAINSTIPVIYQDEVIGAIEVSKDVTTIRKMSNTILDLHKEKLETSELGEEKKTTYNLDDIMAQSKLFSEVIELGKKAAKTSVPVFLSGEVGTGKEIFARSIHFQSERKEGPFLTQNCAALPESLLKDILFGNSHQIDGETKDRQGLFEQGNGGTVFLDEISAMSYELQGKLLSILEEELLKKEDENKTIPVDIRIIASVHQPADQLIEAGKLRRDLFYQLNVIGIELPSLRERKEDILNLSKEFVNKYNKRYRKFVVSISDGAKEKLLHYDYPGNIRELENIIMAAVSMAGEDEATLTEKHILINNEDSCISKSAFDFSQVGMDWYLENMEKEMIVLALAKYERNVSKAAEYLKIKRQTLQHKIKKYNL